MYCVYLKGLITYIHFCFQFVHKKILGNNENNNEINKLLNSTVCDIHSFS